VQDSLTRANGNHMTLDEWYAYAAADADRRQLADLAPVLKGLRAAAEALRAAEWNDEASGRTEASSASSSSSSSPSSSDRASS
jgi:hypothetical protein